ncbi:hypothetical protein ACFLYL_00515 [Chloroflexota bacterium]
MVFGGGIIDGNGLFTAGETRGTFIYTVQVEISQNGTTRYGGATVCIGASMTVTATLQGAPRPLEGYDVELDLKLYDQPVDAGNILTLNPVESFSTGDGNIVITDKPTQEEIDEGTSKNISFIVSALPQGTYNITLYSPHNLVNLKNGVTIATEGTTVDMDTLLEGDARDISEDSLSIDITDLTRFALAYETSSGPPIQPDWDWRADFNRNGQVEITDFSLLYSNYGKTSPRTVE